MKVALYEIKGLNRKRHIIVLLFLLIFSLYFSLAGVFEYRTSLKEKENFVNFEKLRFKKYYTYDIYGTLGHQILLQYSPINIFFDSSSFLKPIEASLDVTEIIKITTSRKGKSLIGEDGFFKGFSGLIFIFGSLFTLLLGLDNFKTANRTRLPRSLLLIIRSQLIRMIYISVNLFILFILVFLFVKLFGISFTSEEIQNFMMFSFYSILMLLFFYIAGLTISAVTLNKRKLTIACGFFFWVMFVVFIPSLSSKYILNEAKKLPSEKTISINKFSKLLDFDIKATGLVSKVKKGDSQSRFEVIGELVEKFFNDVYEPNKKIESGHLEAIRKVVLLKQDISILFPTTYYYMLHDEISTKSYNSIIDFVNYTSNLRYDFMKFYYNKKYFSKDRNVESFIKEDENIFKAESRLPGNFWRGVGITGLYCLILFGVSLLVLHFKLNRKPKERERIKFELKKLEKGKAYFVLCKDEGVRSRLFRQLTGEANVAGLDQISGEDIKPELSPRDIVPYLCHVRGIKDIEKVKTIINRLGIEDFKYFNRRKPAEVSAEDLKKIYAAVMLFEAEDKEIVLINNLLSGVSKQFDRQLIGILQELNARKKMVIYLSDEIYMSVSTGDIFEIINDNDFEIQHINLKHVSLR